MRQNPLKMDEYGISKDAYEELRAFCWQYDHKVAQMRNAAASEEALQKYKSDISDIHKCLKTACEGKDWLEEPLRKAVTDKEYRFWMENVRGNTVCSEHTFIETRRKFFYALAVKKHII